MADEKASKPGHKKKAKGGPKAYAGGKSCPKCGPGVRLGKHDNRIACGKCGYTEYTSPRS